MPVYEEDLAPYVEGAGRASDRNRFVMIVIVIASTLAFGTYWNSRQSSWINSRIGTRQALLRWWACFDTTTGKLKGAVSSGCNLHTNDTVVVRQAELFDSLTHVHMGSRADSQAISSLLQVLREKLADEALSLRVPILGIVLDTNDLGVIGGFGFTVIMMWFAFGLNREHRAVEQVFEAARATGDPARLKRCYDLLSMRQVLTLPPSKSGRHRALGLIPKLIFLLPMGVDLAVVLHDYSTLPVGEAINPGSAKAELWVGSIFWFVIAILTVISLIQSDKVDSAWRQAAKELRM